MARLPPSILRLVERGPTVRAFCFVFAVLFFLLFIFHLSPWMSPPLPDRYFGESILGPNGSHYFGIERVFWSTILAGLTLSFLAEGLSRPRRRRRANVVEEAY